VVKGINAGIHYSRAEMMRILTNRPSILRLLMCLVCTTMIGCAKESGVLRMVDALDQEGSRLNLLSEESGSVDLVPSTEPYWVAFVPSDKSSNVSAQLPLTTPDYDRVCSCAPSGARILVGDISGVGCATTTALDADELWIVRKMKGESVHIHLSHTGKGVRVVAMN
jgi:hypothetical protein